MSTAAVLLRLAYMNLRTQMEYRFNFWVWFVIKVLNYASGYAVVWLILDRFGHIGGWNFAEVLTLWSIVQFSYLFAAQFLFHSVGKLSDHIIDGSLDHYLVQPVHPVANLIARHFSWTYSSQIAMNIAVLYFALSSLPIEWTALRALFLALTLLGAVSFQAFTFLIGAAASFRWLQSGRSIGANVRWLVDLTQYPISIYPRFLQNFLTFFVPVALMNYYPCLYLFEKGHESPYYPALALASPLLSLLLGFLGLLLWNRGLNAYQGGGG